MKLRPLIFVLLLSGCAGAMVGGERTYEKDNQLKTRSDVCEGACIERSEDGNCVAFTKGISEVCLDYFNNIEK